MCLAPDRTQEIDDQRTLRNEPPHDGQACFTGRRQHVDEIAEGQRLVARRSNGDRREFGIDRREAQWQEPLGGFELRPTDRPLGDDAEPDAVLQRPLPCGLERRSKPRPLLP